MTFAMNGLCEKISDQIIETSSFECGKKYCYFIDLFDNVCGIEDRLQSAKDKKQYMQHTGSILYRTILRFPERRT